MSRKTQVPFATRRLTKAEAAHLGVSYTAKRQVPISIKKVTKRTKIYTLRQVREARSGMTVEKEILIHKIQKHNFEIEPSRDWFIHLKELDNSILKKMSKTNAADLETSKALWFEELMKWRGAHEPAEWTRNPYFYK